MLPFCYDITINLRIIFFNLYIHLFKKKSLFFVVVIIKVRDYESRSSSAISAGREDQRVTGTGTNCPTYWTMERLERKERNLPTNLAREVFDALTDVIGRHAARRALPLALMPPPQPTAPGNAVTAATTASVSVSVSPSVSTPPSPSPQPMQMKQTLLWSPPAVTAQPPPPIASVSQSQPFFSGTFMILFPFILLSTLLFFMKIMGVGLIYFSGNVLGEWLQLIGFVDH
jgi:hypothetical protein